MVVGTLERPIAPRIGHLVLNKFWSHSVSKSPIDGGCEYCMPNEKGNTAKLDNWHFKQGNHESYEAGGAEINPADNTLWYWTSTPEAIISSRFKINFCPHCGSNLRGA